VKLFDAGKTRIIGLPYGGKNYDDRAIITMVKEALNINVVSSGINHTVILNITCQSKVLPRN